MLVNPQRRPARPASRSFAIDQPTLLQFVLLSMLLHVLLIVLFGNPTGGARRSDGWPRSLDVTLRRSAPQPRSLRAGPGTAPPQPASLPAPPPLACSAPPGSAPPVAQPTAVPSARE